MHISCHLILESHRRFRCKHISSINQGSRFELGLKISITSKSMCLRCFVFLPPSLAESSIDLPLCDPSLRLHYSQSHVNQLTCLACFLLARFSIIGSFCGLKVVHILFVVLICFVLFDYILNVRICYVRLVYWRVFYLDITYLEPYYSNFRVGVWCVSVVGLLPPCPVWQ